MIARSHVYQVPSRLSIHNSLFLLHSTIDIRRNNLQYLSFLKKEKCRAAFLYTFKINTTVQNCLHYHHIICLVHIFLKDFIQRGFFVIKVKKSVTK
ncbi:hypothetical protein CW304_07765 [Bacillus sp. UFRGS-B20]|nr:hypothetical protein CW304_07765 [Bacillus sp. UFRGS-B20]